MTINILMPALSPTMSEGTLSKWVKKEGDSIAPGDVVAEIETDKATMEVEAIDEGTLGKILIEGGTENVAVNTVIGIMLEEGEDESALKEAEGSAESGSEKPPEPSEAAADNQDQAAATEAKADKKGGKDREAAQSGSEGRIFVSPLAARLAAEADLDLSQIKGSGPRGRIVKADVEKAKADGSAKKGEKGDKAAKSAEGAGAAPVKTTQQVSVSSIDAKAQADALGMAYEEVPNNNIRKTIAKRLLEASQTAPEFFLTIECRIDALLAARKRLNSEHELKVSVNDFVMKASALALRKHPAINAAWTDNAILQFKDVDVSMAVAAPMGLITPIVKSCDKKGLADISAEAKDLAVRARDNKLKPEEFQGGGFSVSNLGMFGIKQFTAILNPPQACILAVGAGEKRVIVNEAGEFEAATIMTCTLTCDHRVVDGAVGAQFLQTFKKYIEDPMAMLL